MPRPSLPVGTYGQIDFLVVGKRIRARAKFRDFDGVTRQVNRFGASRAEAERRLREALRDRSGPASSAINADMKVRDLAAVWLTEVQSSDRADGSKELYERDVRKKVIPALGGLRIRECDVQACDRFLRTVRENSGPGKAKSTKTVLSLLMQHAVRNGAIPANPVRDVAKIPRGRRQPKALTAEQEKLILGKIRGDLLAGPDHQDVADLVEFLDGTGCRIGEALAVRAEVVDLDAKVLEVNATVVRLKGRGSVLQMRTKSEAGWRVIALPDRTVEVVRRRLATTWPRNPHGLLFPPQLGEARNPSNANRDIKAALVRIDPELAWVTSHVWRKTVATRLDDAGLSAREIADHLGHAKPSMTQDTYLGRGVASAKAATVLDEAVG